ncbi:MULTISPECIES: DUF1330 domain-containing protein [Ochrobactrum]|jgi:uncharacterized protein (DUF1330 family)|uniref:DUF1330 domain-containing protein n=1 Tax=Ochrobactrum quorumnocens TaxID=271865 RepID=A0A248UEX3_9HYPH|nr:MULTISPECIES: DUF1330 domain-containing protein [Brucella/Ochrobactrum group]MBD7991284.1 DUF1330 domain-containing protein [Ochrobactrum gallinarum]ASV85228.1 hypothetical protein CES85_2683 [[Ochrobactrum] quorumnocens]KAA9369375.1 DUF1330 domain-containing protein [[Ochrobactrum] quorumnocens]MCV9906232.1 DUF1330 domain-containing protein [Brucella sp. HL-2]MDH7790201.1 uncharacterized protein (DUF1330 family) [Ochrobactrum sp. AN78]
MTKAYWIARVDARDTERYKDYVSTAKPAFERYGAKFIARGGKAEAVEGPGRARNVIIEFESMQHALDCYNSSEYQAAKAIRQTVADGEIVIVEGVA